MRSAYWIAVVVAAGCSCGHSKASSSADDASPSSSDDGGTSSTIDAGSAGNPLAQTETIVAAANAFLDSLSADQLAGVQFPFTALACGSAYSGNGGRVGEQYGSARWSNYPVSDVPRPGVQLGSLTETQYDDAMALLQVVLSAKGYQKVLAIMGADQTLCDLGQQFSCGSAVYTIGIFGMPSVTAPWMIEFGGHHLGLNVVIAGENGVMTPTLTGEQPSIYTASDGTTVRPLGEENDKAYALLAALDSTEQSQAILDYTVGDLVLGPGHDCETITPEGLPASAMTADQQAMLVDLIAEWAGIINDAHAAAHMAQIEAGLPDTYFAWSGPTTHDAGQNGSAYYRIQGPNVIIEFSPQGTNTGADSGPTMHVHTVYRDPTDEYGTAFTLE